MSQSLLVSTPALLEARNLARWIAREGIATAIDRSNGEWGVFVPSRQLQQARRIFHRVLSTNARRVRRSSYNPMLLTKETEIWLEHDGKTVYIDGYAHRLEVSTWRRRYPYEAVMIDVSAVPISKKTAYYREMKEKLGDDWVTDVLASDVEVQADILRQLGVKGNPKKGKEGPTAKRVAPWVNPEADPPRIAFLRRIIKTGQHGKIEGQYVDAFSASAAVQVYDALSPANRAKMVAMPIGKMFDVVWKIVGKYGTNPLRRRGYSRREMEALGRTALAGKYRIRAMQYNPGIRRRFPPGWKEYIVTVSVPDAFDPSRRTTSRIRVWAASPEAARRGVLEDAAEAGFVRVCVISVQPARGQRAQRVGLNIALPGVQLFPLGQIVATPGAIKALQASGEDPLKFLRRHATGDWGLLDAEDKKANDWAVQHGARILSAYKTSKGVKLWIITEADRSATTILLPEEY